MSFYSYARTLFDTSLSYEEIEEEYFSCAFGEDWKKFRKYLADIYDALPFAFFSRDEAWYRKNVHYDLDRAKKIAEIRNITKEGRNLIKSHKKAGARIRSISLKLLEYHAHFCDLVSDWMSAKARGEINLAMELYQKARIETGKFESEVESYFDHNLYFTEYFHAQNLVSPEKEEDIINI